MGLTDYFRRKPMAQVETERQARYERKMKQLSYEVSSATRQKALAQEQAKIAKLRSDARKLAASRPNYTTIVTDALGMTPKKEKK